ncbi:small ribosomal subunit protein uS17m [Palaemon carinicauda]|uniref:small ribosomal subunit protein uS17m n=1 Tax=Palaemon carinicauda TaxID=392227 RepID=UPI0035B5EC53
MARVASKSLMLLGECFAHTAKDATKVRVKRMKFDDYLNMYFSDFAYYFAHDPEQKCKVGDIVLIKELQEQKSKEITHSVMKIVYPYGDITDPISGKKCFVSVYRDHLKKRNEIYGKAEDSEGGFDYEDAPERGWQENKKDFTHKEGYLRWHEFEPGHPLHNDPAAT